MEFLRGEGQGEVVECIGKQSTRLWPTSSDAGKLAYKMCQVTDTRLFCQAAGLRDGPKHSKKWIAYSQGFYKVKTVQGSLQETVCQVF